VSMVLTIDVEFPDRPGPEPLTALRETLSVLDRHQVPATFLVQGRWSLAYPKETAEFAARGHVVGVHGHAHVDYGRLSAAGAEAELRQGIAALTAALPGHQVKWCRLPYGRATSEPRIAHRIERVGLTPLGWDWSSYDWDASLPDEAALTRLLPAAECGGILLFHSWPGRTPWLLDRVLADGRAARVASIEDVELEAASPQGWRMHAGKVDSPR
jgi:peptidoglycan-N-acetylglucosamine deacetylase